MGFWDMIFGKDEPAPPPPPPPPPLTHETGAARRARCRPWEQPHLRDSMVLKGETLHGDARIASPELDPGALKDIITRKRPDSIFLGESLAALQRKPTWEAMYSGDRHLLTVAPTGSGKGSSAIIPNLVFQNTLSIFCIDPKGQNAAVTKRIRTAGDKPVYLLNPFNEHRLGTHSFNPLALLNIDSPNIVADVRSLAEALIISEGKDPIGAIAPAPSSPRLSSTSLKPKVKTPRSRKCGGSSPKTSRTLSGQSWI